MSNDLLLREEISSPQISQELERTTNRITKSSSRLHYNARTFQEYRKVSKIPEFLLSEQLSIHINSKRDFTFFDNFRQENVLEWYFEKSPDERIKVCQDVADYIETVEEIFEILQWGNKTNIRDGYDGAITLLAECDGRLLIPLMLLGHPPYNQHINLLSTEQWEILIKSVACSHKITIIKKYSLILGLMNNYQFWRRLVKSAIIDALWIIEDELDDIELIRPILERFIFQDADLYIRKYAREALDDIVSIIN